MAQNVEARSLASLNTLAANPPQYPTNPTEKRQEPLTLYISRVPGTRDIILSFFKPQVKNVTAADVASSLYYVHFNTPEDGLLVSEPPTNASPQTMSKDGAGSPTHAIQRKPVPPSHASPETLIHLADRDAETPDPGPRIRFEDTNKVHGDHLQEPDQSQEASPDIRPPVPLRPQQPSFRRKPVVPRILTPESLEHGTVPEPSKSSHPLPPIPNDDQMPPPYVSGPSPREYHGRPGSRSSSPSKRKPYTPFTLTLIRRDPTSGHQWNVGEISSLQLENPEQILHDKQVFAPAINIHIDTPGYAKFRGLFDMAHANVDLRELRTSFDTTRPRSSSGAGGSRPSSRQRSPTREQPGATPVATGGFDRQLKMGYGPSWTSSLRGMFHRRSESRDSNAEDSPVTPRSMGWAGHGRQQSAASVSSLGAKPDDPADAHVFTTPGPGLKAQGYVFTSPWNGRCEFRTGNGGRSLLCKHVLPSFGNSWNPLSAGGAGGQADADIYTEREPVKTPKTNAHDISELRFNLPSAELFGHDRSNSDPPKLHEGRQRLRDKIFNQMINKTESDVEDEEYQAVGLDLSLGREKAGGGNRGKRAKMGKLIVWDEGLKMLDLIVAANVGVWWGIWERRSE